MKKNDDCSITESENEVAKSLKNPNPKKVKHFYDINVYGTENILISAVKNRVKKAIIVSSNSPCGVNPNKEHVFDEKCEYNPYLNYGKSKMIMEKLEKGCGVITK